MGPWAYYYYLVLWYLAPYLLGIHNDYKWVLALQESTTAFDISFISSQVNREWRNQYLCNVVLGLLGWNLEVRALKLEA